jgi:hypothetical protein
LRGGEQAVGVRVCVTGFRVVSFRPATVKVAVTEATLKKEEEDRKAAEAAEEGGEGEEGEEQ